ncbi:hypothetical protein [Deinococcus enclensis]|nr:hypothetical protein [Deinococcus enclensis]
MTALLALTGLAGAQDKGQVDCSTLVIYGDLTLQYDTPARKRMALSGRKGTWEACGLRVTGDGNRTTVDAGSSEALAQAMGSPEGQGLNLILLRRDVGVQPYHLTVTVAISLRALWTMDQHLHMLGDTAIGYRLDGGPLMPLLHQGRAGDVPYLPDTQVINLYAQPGPYTEFERVEINLGAGTLSVWRKHDFPKN